MIHVVLSMKVFVIQSPMMKMKLENVIAKRTSVEDVVTHVLKDFGI